MTMRYSVTVSKQPDGRYRVACFGLPDDDWNALAHRVHESYHRTRAGADRMAEKIAAQWKAELL